MKYLDLLAALRDAIRLSDDPDPKSAVPAVMAQISDNPVILRGHIEELLIHLAPTQAGAVRRSVSGEELTGGHLFTDAHRSSAPGQPLASESMADSSPICPPAPMQSRRAKGLAVIRLKLYAEQYSVGDEWKFLEFMTAAEIISNAERREAQAEGLEREAKRLRGIADLVNRYGTTVADVPVDELKEYER